MCEMVDPSISRSELLAYAADIKTKNDSYEGQIEGSYPGENFQRAKWPAKNSDKILSQLSMEESPNKTQEEYLQLHVIPYLNNQRIPLFEASIHRSNAVV